MKKIIIGLVVLVVIAVFCVLIFSVNVGNSDSNSKINILVTEYINALSEKNNDKLYELSMVKELDGDTTFLSKDVLPNKPVVSTILLANSLYCPFEINFLFNSSFIAPLFNSR